MNRILKIVGILVIIYIVVFACNKLISNKLEKDINSSPAMEQVSAILEIERTAKMMNSKMPKSIDEKTTATKVEYSTNENVLTFYYQISDVTKEELASELETLKTNQINFIKKNPNNGTYLKAKVTFKYIYSDINGTELGNYTIVADQYM